MRLTSKTAAALTVPAGKTDHIEFDDDIPGFGLRLRASGVRSWIYQYRIGRQQRRMFLGSAGAIPAAAARETAGKLHAQVKLGGDPAIDREHAIRRAGETVEGVARRYLEFRKPALRHRSYLEIERHLSLHAKPLHRLPVTAVTQRDVSDLLNSIAKVSGDVASNRVRSSLSAFFGWAIREGFRLPEGNPAANTNKREESPRDRVLKPEELKAIWSACTGDYGNIVRLLMLTGQRLREIGELRWREVHDDEIILPADRTKNNRLHTVPLSKLVSAILTALRSDAVYVFGRDGTGFSGWSKAKQRLDFRIAEQTGKAIEHWTLHDLRRTAATGMADLGVQPHIIEAVLNHVSGHKAGVAGIYNRSTYDREKREALNLWAEHLMAVIEGRAATVVPLKRA
jgi:integrase